MASKVDRRRFLSEAGAGLAIGAAAQVAASASEKSSPAAALPLPDAQTKSAPSGAPAPAVCCTPASKLIFPCSGAADVGKIADLAARRLAEDGVGRMFCLAGIGGRVKGILDGTKAAQAILVIDGCPLQCARNTMEQAGFTKFTHLALAELGMEKGKTPATAEAVAKIVNHAKTRWADCGKPEESSKAEK